MQKLAALPRFREEMLPPSLVSDFINGSQKMDQSARSVYQPRFETETFRINISCITL